MLLQKKKVTMIKICEKPDMVTSYSIYRLLHTYIPTYTFLFFILF